MELLIKLAERVKFTYDLHLVGDGQFGSLKKVQFTGSEKTLQNLFASCFVHDQYF